MALHEKFIDLPFHQNDCKRMVLDLQAHRTIVNLLEEQHLNVDDERTITPFCKKLPESIINEIMPLLKGDSSSLTFKAVHDAVADAIKTIKKKNMYLCSKPTSGLNELPTTHGAVYLAEQQRSYLPRYNSSQQNYQSHNIQERPKNTKYSQYMNENQSNSSTTRVNRAPRYVASNHPKHYTDESGRVLKGIYAPGPHGPNLSIIRYSFPFSAPERKHVCNTCEGSHNAIRCPLTSTEFRHAAKKRGLCELCNYKDHSIEQCTSSHMCGYCRGLHFMGACPKKEFYRQIKNYPQNADSIITHESNTKKQFFRAQYPRSQ
ncbi:unnamed protein product [Caenorhabditis nigoni]